MLPFLVLSRFFPSTQPLYDIKEREFVAILGEPNDKHLMNKILQEVSGTKFILSTNNTHKGIECFHLKIYQKESLKIAGVSFSSNDDKEVQEFLMNHKDINILLLDADPKQCKHIWEYIQTYTPKYVFYNSKQHLIRTINNTKIIGVATFAVERYRT